MVVEDREGATIGRHRMVVKVAADDRSQPLPLEGDCLMPPLSQFLLDFLGFARMRSPRDFLWSRKLPLRDLPQMKVNPRKLKVGRNGFTERGVQVQRRGQLTGRSILSGRRA